MGAAPGTPSQVAATVVSKGSLALHRAPTVLAASFIGKDELRPTRNHPGKIRKVEHDLLEDDSSKTGLVYFQNSFKSKFSGSLKQLKCSKISVKHILSNNM